jgi:hypothetical protein
VDPSNHFNADLGDTLAEEGISEADAIERVGRDPDTVPNLRDPREEHDVPVTDAAWPEEH